jgi:hypothetical protein
MLCERLSRHRLELGLVPLGTIGISLFAFDLAYSGARYLASSNEPLQTVGQFLASPGGPRILGDLLMIAVFSGFYTVPLMTFIQHRSAGEVRSRVIAGNNILNSFLIVTSSLVLVGLLAAGISIPVIFAILAACNFAVAACIYVAMPEFIRRFKAWCGDTARLLLRRSPD